MSDGAAQVAVTVERLVPEAADLRAVEAIARESFDEQGFSAKEETERPWSRIWIARDANDVIVGILVAWHVADEIHVLNVATRATLRRRGVATALLETA